MNRTLHPDALVARLMAEGLVSSAQVELAETEQRRRGGSVARLLCELGFVGPEDYAERVAREAGIPVLDPNLLRADPEVAGLIPVALARQLRVLPIARRNGRVVVAMADPCDVLAVDQVRCCLGVDPELVVAPEREILNALDGADATRPGIQQNITRWLAEEAPEAPALDSITHQSGIAEDTPVVRLVEDVLARAVEMGASDVHFEPAERWLRIRLRVDGLLIPDALIPKPLQSAVTARLKVLGDLDVAESRVPQDGRSSLWVNRRRYNLRLSSLPTQYGESVVVRLLPAEAAILSVAQLGLDAAAEAAVRQVIANPHGVVVVTGPTGSGKSTTLYALLRELNQADTGVFTLEDPVEMPLAGARQTQIHEEAGLTYAAALRALLRQDPDVILVGETRDSETAQLMIRAALTGHLVLTTLHTNDAWGAIPRLLDMGVEPCLLSGCLVAVLAQRLVRCLCLKCRQPMPQTTERLVDLGGRGLSSAEVQLWRPVGCADCRGTGYRGRRAIFELLTFEEPFRSLLAPGASRTDFDRLTQQTGRGSLWDDGLRQVRAGVTTVEEVRQVTRQE